MTEIVAILNAGFRVAHGDRIVLIDPLLTPSASLPVAPQFQADRIDKADLILVTHAHWDHLDAEGILAVATRTGAAIAGPAAVMKRLHGRLPAAQAIELEPAEGQRPPASVAVDVRGIRITAFRTYHSRGHNSCLLEIPGQNGGKPLRLFDDGDNEDTRPLDLAAIGPIDVLLLGGPWQGSAWAEFVDRLRPGRWLLMHLTAEELDAHAAGRYLPDLCDRVPRPDGLVALRPSQALSFRL